MTPKQRRNARDKIAELDEGKCPQCIVENVRSRKHCPGCGVKIKESVSADGAGFREWWDSELSKGGSHDSGIETFMRLLCQKAWIAGVKHQRDLS